MFRGPKQMRSASNPIPIVDVPSKGVGGPAPLLSPSDIHVWEISLTTTQEKTAELAKLLSPDETSRASRFHFEQDARKYVTARGSLRAILGGYLRIPPRELRFVCSKHGKPSLDDAQGEIRFNVSHSGELALIAVAQTQNVGVDVEAMREDVETDKLAERFFSVQEREAIRALAPEQRVQAFFRCWTCKEALLKAQGVGLFRSLNSFDVEVNPALPARLLGTRPDAAECGRWHLYDIHVPSGYAAAVAIEGSVSSIRVLRTDGLRLA